MAWGRMRCEAFQSRQGPAIIDDWFLNSCDPMPSAVMRWGSAGWWTFDTVFRTAISEKVVIRCSSYCSFWIRMWSGVRARSFGRAHLFTAQTQCILTHSAARDPGTRLDPLSLLLLEIPPPQPGDGEHVGLQALADELARNAQPGIVDPGWNVADEICELSFLPVLGRRGPV